MKKVVLGQEHPAWVVGRVQVMGVEINVMAYCSGCRKTTVQCEQCILARKQIKKIEELGPKIIENIAMMTTLSRKRFALFSTEIEKIIDEMEEICKETLPRLRNYLKLAKEENPDYADSEVPPLIGSQRNWIETGCKGD
ncbi:MAG: hypothetical protein MJA29_01785 [Candidatus Omnitrophica bacterium]|nr:hypothetical protein [Candidatus Omnitrophota bacterium]